MGFRGLPGTQMTRNGYDNEHSFDPICWLSRSQFAPVRPRNDLEIFEDINATTEEEDSMLQFPNPLVQDFMLRGQVELLLECPERVNVTVFPPEMFSSKDVYRPRTFKWYNYRVQASLDLDHLMGDFVVSDYERPRLAVQVLLCYVKRSGFCSPFVHEHANSREGGPATVKVGDRHGESHVHSPYVFVDLDANERFYELDVEVPTVVNDPGDYFVIGSVQFFTGNASHHASYRYDASNAIQDRVVHYQEPMELLVVRPVVEWAVVGVCSLACGLLAYILWETIRHRKNQVLQLSQGNFLILSLVAAIWAVASVFLLNPRSALYCNLSSPMILIPTQLIYAITIGRLWRIEQVVSPLLKSERKSRILSLISNFLACFTSCRSSSGLRNSVSNFQLGCVVAIFTIPHIMLQASSLIWQPLQSTILTNEDESVGRIECSASTFRALTSYCWFFLFFSNLVLLIFAQSCKNLPSLFNEMEVIHASTLVNAIVLALGYVVVAVSRGPTTNPEVDYIILASIVLSINLNSTLRIVLPKLRMIWRGEVVLVSKLVSDHRASITARRKSSVLQNVSGFNPESTTFGNEDLQFSSTAFTVGDVLNNSFNNIPSTNSGNSSSNNNNSFSSSGGRRSSVTFRQDVFFEERDSSEDYEDVLKPEPEQRRRSSIKSGGTMDTATELAMLQEEGRQRPNRIVIQDNQTPSRALVVPMMRLQQRLNAVSNRITSGASVSHNDWEAVRSLNAGLAATFSRAVEFEWEKEENLAVTHDGRTTGAQ